VDTDGDGWFDGEEIRNMTDLFDSRSSLRITSFAIVNFGAGFNTAAVEFTSFPGLPYTAQVSVTPDFASPRDISLGNPTDFLSGYNLFLALTEQYVRIKRN
jgi:hypothetical protein